MVYKQRNGLRSMYRIVHMNSDPDNDSHTSRHQLSESADFVVFEL